MTAAPTRPVLRWHGGKWRLAPWILEHLPPHRIYVEPYMGACSVFMRKPRSYAEVINDLDNKVVNLFRVLRDPAKNARLQELLTLTPFSRAEQMLSYECHEDDIERARRLVVGSYMGFGSNGHQHKTGFRNNTTRTGTTPAVDWANYPHQLATYCQRLAGVIIENKPALELIAQLDNREALFYVDPPYVGSTRDAGGDYAHEMTDADHRALAGVLNACQGMVVLSGYPSELYDNELFPSWRRVEKTALADGAAERTEVLWINDAASRALDAMRPQKTLSFEEISHVDK